MKKTEVKKDLKSTTKATDKTTLIKDEESKIRETAYYLSKKGHTYNELCWFLAERQLKVSNPDKTVSKDEIKKKAEEIFNFKKKYDELCWLIAKIDTTKKI